MRLERHNSPRPIVLGVNRDEPEGQALLNAFMAESIKQREELFMRNLAEVAQKHKERQEMLQDEESAGGSDNLSESEETPQGESEETPQGESEETPQGESEETPQSESEETPQSESELENRDQEEQIEGDSNNQSDPPQKAEPEEESLDISFEDDDSEIEDADDPQTVTPPLPGEATLDSMAQADIDQLEQLIGSGPSAQTPQETEDLALKAPQSLDEGVSESEGLSEMFNFVTSAGSIDTTGESDS